jgi:hypothetical protein
MKDRDLIGSNLSSVETAGVSHEYNQYQVESNVVSQSSYKAYWAL